MKIVKYYCDEDAPNYVLYNNVCIDTRIGTKVVLEVKGNNSNLLIRMAPGGNLQVHLNYAWDGATAIPDTRKNLFASLIHDALYQIMRVYYKTDKLNIGGMTRKDFKTAADKLYKELCIKKWGILAFCHFRLCRHQIVCKTCYEK